MLRTSPPSSFPVVPSLMQSTQRCGMNFLRSVPSCHDRVQKPPNYTAYAEMYHISLISPLLTLEQALELLDRRNDLRVVKQLLGYLFSIYCAVYYLETKTQFLQGVWRIRSI